MKALLSTMNARLRDDSPVYGNVKWPAACTQDQKEEPYIVEEGTRAQGKAKRYVPCLR